MRIVVFPHDLDMGGSQMNAIEIAAAVRDLGVEVTVFGRPGALNARISELGLDFVEAPRPGLRPSPSVVRALARTAAERGATVLHGYEWPPALECYLAAAHRPGTVSVSTVMSMAVAPFIPRTMPLLVGTEQIASAERTLGRRAVGVMEPPVDLVHNGPVAGEEVAGFRSRHGLQPGDLVIVCVTRLAQELKSEGLLSAITAVGDMPAQWAVRLLVVGDGPARKQIEAAAEAANARAGRPVVVLTGQLLDPRAAYASADVVLGMGGSALRALAYAKPLVVQGEGGYFRLLDEGSTATFLWQGWYGVGQDRAQGPAAFTEIIGRLVADAGLRARSARLGHQLVVDRFSLAAAARRQVELYESVSRARPSTSRLLAGAAAAAPAWVRHEAPRRVRRVLGRHATDDFNHKPVAGSGPTAAAPACSRDAATTGS